MRGLGRFSDDDGVSQLPVRLGVTSTVYCLSDMRSPWGFAWPRRPSPA